MAPEEGYVKTEAGEVGSEARTKRPHGCRKFPAPEGAGQDPSTCSPGSTTQDLALWPPAPKCGIGFSCGQPPRWWQALVIEELENSIGSFGEQFRISTNS